MCGGHNTRLGPLGVFTPHRIELTLLKHPKELGLKVRGGVPDLVEEDRALPRELEVPLFPPTAPVNAPRTCPKSSDSNSVSVSAVQLTAINGSSEWIEWSCTARATISFPVPVSPLTNTVARFRERTPIIL